MEYLDLAKKYVEDRLGADADPQTVDVLDALGVGAGPARARPDAVRAELDWVAKLKLLEQYRDRDGLEWDDAKLQLIDLPVLRHPAREGPLPPAGRGWAGSSGCSTTTPIEVAMHDPPDDTRAYFRGRCLEKYAEHVAAASWDSVIFDLPGRESLQRVPTIDPLRGSKAHVGELLDRCETAEALVHRAHAAESA